MEARDSVGIAVAGSGRWGMEHVRIWSDLGCLRVICDKDHRRLQLARERFPSVDVTSDFAEVLSRDDVNGVVVATPALTHVRLGLRALEAGKDVLIEKPLATSLDDGERVRDRLARSDSVLMVGHVLEYHPAFLKLRELVESNALGGVRYVHSSRLNFGRVRTEESALWSFAPHDIALVLRLVGILPTQVGCTGQSYLSEGVADVTLMDMRFPGSVMAYVFVSWLHPFKEHRFVVVGEDQMAVFDDTADWNRKLVVYPHKLDWAEGRIPLTRRAEGEAIPLEPEEPLRAECLHFLARMRDRQPPLTGIDSALQVLRVLEAGETSMRQGDGPVTTASLSGSPDPYVHPSAELEPGAEIGAGTRVWHFSHVMSGARIGPQCILGQNVFVGPGVIIGKGVKIQNNVSVYQGVVLEDQVFCGPSVVFTNVVNPRSGINRKDEFRPTVVRLGATLGANSTIVCGVTIGQYAFVGAGAVVTKDVPAFALVTGVPAKISGWVCRCGVKLPFEGETLTCSTCGRRYSIDSDRISEKSASYECSALSPLRERARG